MSNQNLSKENLTLVSKTIAMLSADGVEKAASGHPGMPMGMADIGAVLWLQHLNFNPRDPKWLNRDRFVLSNGHGSMFLYSMLHLSGYELSLDDLKNFRQWQSRTPGHPEFGMTPGVECTTGPLGQGISNAVGMAIAQKIMAERYNTPKHKIFDHRVYCFVGDGCLMEGISGEASSIAGHLGLGNLIVLYDDNHISIAGDTKLAFTEDVLKRYEAYGWHTLRADGHDFDAIQSAISAAKAVTDRPTIIALRTLIGKGSPNKANSHSAHGAPLGAAEIEATKKALGVPADQSFYIPEEVEKIFAARIEGLTKEYQNWQQNFAAWQKENPELATKLKQQLTRTLPADLDEKLVAAVPTGKAEATRKLSESVLQVASANVSSLIGGSADLEPSNLTYIKGSSDIQKDHFSGVNIRFGVREHAMGAIINGLSYYGGFTPYGSTFLVFADYMRPAIRVAALSHISSLFIFTHDSIFVGEDGPTHEPIEHLASLRVIPNVYVLRPADGLETAMCYSIALNRKDGPSVFALTRQNLPELSRPASFTKDDIKKGAYVVYESKPGAKSELVIVASGSEVALGVSAAQELGANTAIRVVSMPCYELFKKQSEQYQLDVIPSNTKKVTIEAGSTFGWIDMVKGSAEDTLCIGIDHFGASAPCKILAEQYGLTSANVTSKIKARFGL